ncbi:MAG: AMP-binding protein, partial [Steroidobacteraceae bacterium]
MAITNSSEWQSLPRKLGELAARSTTTAPDLSLLLAPMHEGLTVTVEYPVDRFDRATIECMTTCWMVLLDEMLQDTGRSVAELTMLTSMERDRVLYVCNDTATHYPRHLLVHKLFEEQVRRTPDATAVVHESCSLSYAVLNRQANGIARYLRSKGVVADEPVGIYIERSVEMIVGVIATLKAGGAYLPLDPAYPPERLAFMIEDGQGGVAKPVLLAQVDLLAASVAGAGARLIDLDSAAGPAGDADDPLLAPLDGGAGPDNLAYV